MLKKFVDAKARIWGEEAHACNIGFVISILDGKPRYYAECETTLENCRLSERNCEAVLSDMFYDYCCENACWTKVS